MSCQSTTSLTLLTNKQVSSLALLSQYYFFLMEPLPPDSVFSVTQVPSNSSLLFLFLLLLLLWLLPLLLLLY